MKSLFKNLRAIAQSQTPESIRLCDRTHPSLRTRSGQQLKPLLAQTIRLALSLSLIGSALPIVATPSLTAMAAAVNLIVTKTTSTPSVDAGGAATYTIKVTNPSSSSVSNVSITDTLPSGFTYDASIGLPVLQNSASRTATVNPTVGSTSPNWGTFSLPANASVSITFTANTDNNQATGTYQNPVAVNYTDANGNQTANYNPSSSTAEDVQVTGAIALPPPPPPAPPRSSAGICAIPGKDGPASGGIVNTYYPGNASVSAGSQSITLGSAAGAATAISSGDLLLVIQMQDATINATNTAAYGSGNSSNDGRGQTSMGNSGLYEYVVATNSVPTSGGTLNFKGAPSGGTGGLINSYNNANATGSQGQRRFQVVRVPQYSNLTLTTTVRALEWNGRVGGIVVADIAGQLNFNGRTIDGINRGFRAGYSQKNSSGASLLDYVGTNSLSIGAGKGEGTAGMPQFVWNGTLAVNNGSQGYPNGDYGRGAPANAGGGGNFHNAGGGGGGNGGVGGNGGIPWAGLGALDSGGRGGALSSLFAPDPARLFLGGGGGGGDANDATTGVRGGVGAGLVILRSGVMAGSGIINVTGDAGDVGAFGGAPDGAGGGGAGGTVLVAARQNSSTANLSILANGGAGGNTLNDGGNEHGPGAGGGGGVVLHNVPGAALTPTVLGGANGRAAGGTGIAHGATPGQDGQVAPFTSSSDPFATVNDDGCLPKLTVWKSTTTPKIPQGGVATYKITVSNGPGRATATGVDIQDVLPTDFTYDSLIAINLGTGVTRTTLTNPTAGSTTATWGKFDIPPGDKLQITFQAKSNAAIALGTYQNPVVANYLDPKRVNPNDTTSTSYDAAANAAEDVTVVAPVSSNPNVLLVKRITAINGTTTTFGGDSLSGYIDDPSNAYDDNTITIPTQPTRTDPPKDTENWPPLGSFMLGGINGGKVKPSDEIEYTIYFLSAGDATAPKVLICDRIPDNVTFIPTAFNSFPAKNSSGLSGGDRGIIWKYNGNTESLTNINDGDGAQYFPPGVEPSTVYNDPSNPSKKVVDCGGANINGAIVVNLDDLPNATAPGTPIGSYGFIRFRGRVK